MSVGSKENEVETVVIGAGQAGLAVGYQLKRRKRSFVILEANEKVGDRWRNRWDSLRLFTPAQFDGLAGMPFPAADHSFPTKNEMGAYLQAYAAHFDLPIRTGVRVDRVTRAAQGFLVTAGDQQWRARNVVVAMATYQEPRVPPFATKLDPSIVQLHSSEYRNPSQLREGGVLVVGAGNSGAEIAKELAPGRRVWLSGRDVGEIPFRLNGFVGRRLVRFVFRVLFHRVLTVRTPIGRKARPSIISKGGPLIRVKSRDLVAAGVERVSRVVEARDGLPVLDDGRTLDVSNVIWCTGFHPGFSWIDLPVMGGDGEPRHQSGVVPDEPGLYFVGLHFLHAFSSTMIHGVSRDAERIAGVIAARAPGS